MTTLELEARKASLAREVLNLDSLELVKKAADYLHRLTQGYAPASEDIGRVKIPEMLRRRFGDSIRIDIVAGTDFPDDLTGYDIVIHCGACMFSRKLMMERIASARRQNTPITNYGMTIAWAKGILGKVAIPVRQESV